MIKEFILKNPRIGTILLIISISLSICLLISFSFNYLTIIWINVAFAVLIAILFRRLRFYSFFWGVTLTSLLSNWESIDIQINKNKYYAFFAPLMNFECIAGYDFSTGGLTKSYHCYTFKISEMDSILFNKKYSIDNELIIHLKKLGCVSIESSKNMIQLWYPKFVFTITMIEGEVNYEVSELH